MKGVAPLGFVPGWPEEVLPLKMMTREVGEAQGHRRPTRKFSIPVLSTFRLELCSCDVWTVLFLCVCLPVTLACDPGGV